MKCSALLATATAMFCSLASAEIIEKTITFDDNLGSAVLYYDDQVKNPQTGVVVVHEWWGLNEYSRGRARALAQAGYPAIAVDMYGHGKVAEHAKDAMSFMKAAQEEPELMNARFQQARKVLAQSGGVAQANQYAIGYCFGGAVVLNQARSGADLAGVASFHGSLGTDKRAQAGSVNAKILVATGGADPMVPPDQVGDFVTEMSLAGVDLQLLSFPAAKHSFTNPDADAFGKANEMPLAYDADADARSWAALMRFLGGAPVAQ